MVRHVAERLHEVLKVENIGITIQDPNTGQFLVRENYYISLPSFDDDRFSVEKFKFLMRLSERGGGRSWVVNTNAEKSSNIQLGERRYLSLITKITQFPLPIRSMNSLMDPRYPRVRLSRMILIP